MSTSDIVLAVAYIVIWVGAAALGFNIGYDKGQMDYVEEQELRERLRVAEKRLHATKLKHAEWAAATRPSANPPN